MKDIKFMRCNLCGNIHSVIKDSGVIPVCCGQPMEVLEPNSTDASGEKHVPVIQRSGNHVTVKVGSVPHPMVEEHYIQWIAISQNGKSQLQHLEPGNSPEASFDVSDGSLIAYEYCNLHGLWKAEG